MIFLQPFILWGLPLVLLPLVIHLLNRLRYRTVHWAAMSFLLAATRQSTRHARVRQWLILACRMLGLACLVGALSRPLVGGWVGLAMGGPPDTIVVLVDRSASMAATMPGENRSKLAAAMARLASAGERAGAHRFVLIDSATRTPLELASPAQLTDSLLVEATDGAADLPAMVDLAATYLQETRSGTAELWIASDLRRGDWEGSDGQWAGLRARLDSLPQPVTVRLLALDGAAGPNRSIRVLETATWEVGNERQMQLTIQVEGGAGGGEELPLLLNVNGSETGLTVVPGGGLSTFQQTVSLGPGGGAGWGSVALPADPNPRDNVAWFAYGEQVTRRTVILAHDEEARAFLMLAAAPLPDAKRTVAIAKPASEAGRLTLAETSLVIWQGPFPPAAEQAYLRQFVEDGGVLLAFPGETPGEALFELAVWGESTTAPDDQVFAVVPTPEQAGPLRPAASGEPLPLDELEVVRRVQPMLAGETLARFADGQPLIVRHAFGRGQVVMCATIPAADWSNLTAGPVLVPFVQRLLHAGAERLTQVERATVGQVGNEAGGEWKPLGTSTGTNPQTAAGLYRHDDTLVVLNRPDSEDDPAVLPEDEARALFAGLDVHLLADRNRGERALQSEVWRGFLLAMLVLLVGESVLTLPRAKGREEVTG